ncbi:ATP-binding protein [Streptomyces sp. NPDC058008]|uniref:ATP-binding protein n=1 Tax=Streptomyces sp. NPDC058008 TaxID=3346303 RepID=UPI0036E69681
MPEYDAGSPLRSVLPFEAEPARVRNLRNAVRGQLTDWGLAAMADEAELAVSELASNVIKHVGGGTAATLVLEHAGERLRIEMHDMSRRPPVLVPLARDDEEGGRGLRLLAGVTADWGTSLTVTGKAVWCELSAGAALCCRRMRRAEAVLTRYQGDVGAPAALRSRSAQALEESATGLIADILHWVVARGGDPDGFLDRAQMHFEADAA